MSRLCNTCRNNPCVMSSEDKESCPEYDNGKPMAYNHTEAEKRIKELEKTLEQADEVYDIQGKQLLKALDQIGELNNENEKLKAELNELRRETEKTETIYCDRDYCYTYDSCDECPVNFNERELYRMTPQEAIELFKRRIRVLKQTKKASKRSAIYAMEMAIDALEKMSNTNHLCIRCANNRDGCCPSQDFIACGDFEESDADE